jgi:hypothetical protein
MLAERSAVPGRQAHTPALLALALIWLRPPPFPRPQAHKAYLDSTDHRTKAFRSLQANDGQAARVIEQRMCKLVKLQVPVCGTRGEVRL